METKITQVQETTAVDDKGQPLPSVRVTFTVGPYGPFSVMLPKSQFSAMAANLKIAEFAQHIKGLQGLG